MLRTIEAIVELNQRALERGAARVLPAVGQGSLLTLAKMKAFATASCLLVFAQSAAAMVYTDSRVVSLAELAREGIRVDLRRPAGLAGRVFVSVEVLAVDRTFRAMAFSVVDRQLDADFASTDAMKSGIRDAKRWAREERGGSTEKKSMTFALTRAESPRCYVVLKFTLPSREGIPVFGSYYLVVSEAEKEANRLPEPTPTSLMPRANETKNE
jgi:hypothetical protein